MKEKIVFSGSYPTFGEFDVLALRKLIIDNNVKKVIEIGSWLGQGSTQIFGSLCDEITCIDHFIGNGTHEMNEFIETYSVFDTFVKNTTAIREKIAIIPFKSTTAAHLLADSYFDMVFIDGAHSYEATINDIQNYLPKIRKGGILCGHDAEGSPSDFGVEFLNKWRNHDHADSPLPKFRHVHPGVIIAVAELLGDDVHYFANDDGFTLADGTLGRSSIWAYVKP